MFKRYSAWSTRQAATVLAAACLALSTPIMADSSVQATTVQHWIALNLAENPELLAARAAMNAAEAGIRAADQALFNPELALDLERTDVDTRSAGISQTIDWSDKREARTRVARLQKKMAALELQTLRQRLAAKLLQSLTNRQTAAEILKTTEKQLLLMDRFADLAERRRNAGDLGQAELGLARLAAADARFQLASAKAAFIRAKAALAALTGRRLSTAPPTGFATRLPPADITTTKDIDKRLDHLPSLLAAQVRISLASAGVTLKKRQRRADPTIRFRLGTEDDTTLAGINVSIPLFVRNSFKAEVDQAEATVLQTSRNAAALRRQAKARLLAAADLYRNARDAWRQWEVSGAPVLGQRTELLDRLWRAGEMRTTDYLVQLKQTLETETNAIEQRGLLWRAWADWLFQSGTIDQWLSGEDQS